MKGTIEATLQIKLALYKEEAEWLLYYINKQSNDSAIDVNKKTQLANQLNDLIERLPTK